MSPDDPALIEIHASGESCICDFTYDFYWQHHGSRLDPNSEVGGKRYRDLVEALKAGGTVRIHGDVGGRLGSSLGVDLISLGGRGGPIEAGRIIVDGDVGPRMGISMIRGSIYLSGQAAEPLGNVVEVISDLSGYRKFVSITEMLEGGPEATGTPLSPNSWNGGIIIEDRLLRDTVGSRSQISRKITVRGDLGMSTGILMKNGLIEIIGDCTENTGVLLKGGRIIVRGRTGDFTAAEMRSGEIFIEASAGSFACAKMSGGAVYARNGKPVPPARASPPRPDELKRIAECFGISTIQAMMYRKLSL